MARTALSLAVVAAVVTVVFSLPAENATAPSAQANPFADLPPRPGHIMVRPPAPHVEEAGSAPAPQAVRVGRPAANPITFPRDQLQLADDRQDVAQDVTSWDSLRSGCGETKNCLAIPAGCEQGNTRCDGIVTVQVIGGKYTFRMRAYDAKWVAVGLGNSDKMFDTSVVECSNEAANGGTIAAHLCATGKEPTRECVRLNVNPPPVELVNGRDMNGDIFCEVTRISRIRHNDTEWDLDQTPYYLQLAFGTAFKTNSVGYHFANRIASGTKAVLSEYTDLGVASNWPMRLHGSLMVIAWIFAATAGSFAARYFKAAWGKATICGKAMWFAWHRLFMIITVVLHVTAVIAALIYLNGWSASSGVHGILGGVTTGLALLQGAAGLLRPNPDDKLRPVFNWAHRLQGFITHALAVITIFFAVPLSSAQLPSYTFAILGVYVAFYFVMHGLHSLTEVKSWYFLLVTFVSAVAAVIILVFVVIAPGS